MTAGKKAALLTILVVAVAVPLSYDTRSWTKPAALLQIPAPPAVGSPSVEPAGSPPPSSHEHPLVQPAPPAPRIPDPASLQATPLAEIDALIQEGHLTEASAKLQRLGTDRMADTTIRADAAARWNNLGDAQARAAGARAPATAAYQTAVRLGPRNPIAYMNLVLAYWEGTHPALTDAMLEEAMRLAPDDPMPHVILAERLIERDDLAGASTHLEHARAHSADSPAAQSYLQSQMATIDRARRSEQRLRARDSRHFTVKYDGGEDYDVWIRVLEILEDAYRDIGRHLGHYPEKPILVVLHTKESFHDATGGPTWSDGLYDPGLGRIKIPTQGALTNHAWLTRVLRHEYVHALLEDRLGGRFIPQWLNEGLAMRLAGDAPPDLSAIVQGDGHLFSLTALEGSWTGLSPEHAQLAYLEGNSATKYLLERVGLGTVGALLAQVAQGQAFPAAFQDRTALSYEDFQRRWIAHLNDLLEQRGR